MQPHAVSIHPNISSASAAGCVASAVGDRYHRYPWTGRDTDVVSVLTTPNLHVAWLAAQGTALSSFLTAHQHIMGYSVS